MSLTSCASHAVARSSIDGGASDKYGPRRTINYRRVSRPWLPPFLRYGRWARCLQVLAVFLTIAYNIYSFWKHGIIKF
jgi:hypothetical protein